MLHNNIAWTSLLIHRTMRIAIMTGKPHIEFLINIQLQPAPIILLLASLIKRWEFSITNPSKSITKVLSIIKL